MGRSSSSYIVRALVIAAGLAVIASAVNLTRVEWTAEHRATSPEVVPPSATIDTPAAKLDALQRQLNEMERRNLENQQETAAKSNAAVFLEMSSAPLFLCVAVMVYQQRRAAKGAVG